MKPFSSAIQLSSGSLFSAYAEVAAYRMLGKTVINDVIDVIPSSLKSRVSSLISGYFNPQTKLTTIVIEEQSGMSRNAVFDSAELYLSTKISPNADRFKVTKTPKQKTIKITMEKGQLITDTFGRDDSIHLEWRVVSVPSENNWPEKCLFELSFEKQHRDAVVDEYLPFVMTRADEIKNSDRAVRLYAQECAGNREDDDYGGNGLWGSVQLDHPSTFDKLAMEPEMKKALIEDLDRFLRRKDYYNKVGKAWKRGYLLYGPPGTGKSSLIAAIANYLKFDVYNLELTGMHSDSQLRSIMLSTTNRSILVIEDIDCSVETHDRDDSGGDYQAAYYSQPNYKSQKFTLSGLLNVVDGLWSSCGDERIIIFTTNHKDRLDPALLRPGRMDMHVHLSYCTPAGFRTLASNYQGIGREHNERLFDEIEGLIDSFEVTPAVIAEELMRSEDADAALEGVKTLLIQKLAEKNDAVATVELNDEEEEDHDEEKVEDDQQHFEEVGRKRIPALRGGCVSGRKQMRRDDIGAAAGYRGHGLVNPS